MNRRFALLVGTSTYKDPALSKLRAPAHDLNLFSSVLAHPELGGFDVIEMLDRTEAEVRVALGRFFQNRRTNDMLLLYFSGHGLLDEEGELYLAMNNTERDVLSATGLSASFIRKRMDNCMSQRQVLLLDCCHGGAFSRGSKGIIGGSVGTKDAFSSTGYGRIVLTASDAMQFAWEDDSEVKGAPHHSVFTRVLAEGLESGDADLDGDGRITVHELHNYVHDRLVAEGRQQRPHKWTYGEQGDLVVARTRGPSKRTKRTEVETEELKRMRISLARFQEQNGEWDELVDTLYKLVAISDSPVDKANFLTQTARVHTDHTHDIVAAIETWNSVLGLTPRSKEALNGLKSCYEIQGAWHELEQTLISMLSDDLDHSDETKKDLWSQIANNREHNLSCAEEASQAWTQVLRIDPTDELAASALERIYSKQSQWRRIIHLRKHQILHAKSSHDRATYQGQIASILAFKLNEHHQAIELCIDALEASPCHTETSNLLERIYEAREEWRQLGNFLLWRAKQHSGPTDQRLQILLRASKTFEDKAEDLESALDSYMSALDLDYQNLAVGIEVARLASSTNSWSLVLERYESRIADIQDPIMSACLLCQLAIWHGDHLRSPYSAIDRLQKALYAKPRDPSILWMMSKYYGKAAEGEIATCGIQARPRNTTLRLEGNPEAILDVSDVVIELGES